MSAYTNFNPHKKAKHQLYTQALEQLSKTKVILGKFKKKKPRYGKCDQQYDTCEEKESDVNIAIQILEDAFLDRMDKVFLVTADTDLNSTIVRFKQLFPDKKIILLIPPKRLKQSYELQQNANTLRAGQYKRNSVNLFIFIHKFMN
ncbi:NYN domain-containing protein [Campylobacter sp. MIT 97-5078]|uniref:NYN domain-containing protein n=1 Tax=Campylobacter sp. MIT 97-5078 TaxID=1548153 RepID=UPI001E30312E|nr:NYN domain-containing protein [Campylobacter sp. MIT 97-5078]